MTRKQKEAWAPWLLLVLVLMPPALGGFFRLLQAVDRNAPAAPSQVTAMFGDGPVALRLIACNALFALLTAVFGRVAF